MGDIKMSAIERKRLEMLSRVKDRLITQVKASELLGPKGKGGAYGYGG